MGEIRETDLFTSERDNYSNAIYRLEKEIASSQSELSKIRMKISDKESDIRNSKIQWTMISIQQTQYQLYLNL